MNILVIGPTNLDVQTSFSPEKRVYSSQTIGGKGYNVAKNLTVLGQDVFLSSVIGNDSIGKFISTKLKQDNINVTPNSYCSEESMVYTELLEGANNSLCRFFSTELFNKERPPEIDWNNIDICIVLSSTLETILEYVFENCKMHSKIKVILGFSGKRDNLKIKRFLPFFDMIIGNEKEFTRLFEELSIDHKDSHYFLYETFQIPCIIETQGEKGALITILGNSLQLGVDPLNLDEIISTIGAGDSVTAGVVYYHYSLGFSWKDSLKKAMELAKGVLKSKQAYLKNIPKK